MMAVRIGYGKLGKHPFARIGILCDRDGADIGFDVRTIIQFNFKGTGNIRYLGVENGIGGGVAKYAPPPSSRPSLKILRGIFSEKQFYILHSI